MPIRFAINGLGRVGRALLRIAHDRDGLEVAAVNDIVPAPLLARQVARDTVGSQGAARPLRGAAGPDDDRPQLHRKPGAARSAPFRSTPGAGGRVVAWYDNEWGYAHRLADLLERLQ